MSLRCVLKSFPKLFTSAFADLEQRLHLRYVNPKHCLLHSKYMSKELFKSIGLPLERLECDLHPIIGKLHCS